MSERDINRWQETITPRDKAPQPWTIGSGGSWDMTEVQPIPDAMLAELAQRYQCAGTPWNCRSMPLSDSDREYMYLLYYSMQGLVARLRRAEAERDEFKRACFGHISDNSMLRAKIAAMENQEPVAYGTWDTQIGRSSRMMMVRLDNGQDGCRVPLYASPGAKGE